MSSGLVLASVGEPGPQKLSRLFPVATRSLIAIVLLDKGGDIDGKIAAFSMYSGEGL